MRSHNEIIAKRLMEIAAAHSVNAPQGWASHTCSTLVEAARILRGEPEPKTDDGRISARRSLIPMASSNISLLFERRPEMVCS